MLLSFDSSAVTASAALTDGERVIKSEFVNAGLTHSETLLPMIKRVMQGYSFSALDGIAVTAGPGSFTGVRIGIATAKGLAFKDNISCIGVSTLEAIAQPLNTQDVIACAVMDARCNQVYTASFIGCKRLSQDRAILIDELADELKEYGKKTVFIGDGAELCYERLKDKLDNVSLADESIRYIHASGIGFIAEEKTGRGESPVNSAKLVPFYLRLPQAERELKNKKESSDESFIRSTSKS